MVCESGLSLELSLSGVEPRGPPGRPPGEPPGGPPGGESALFDPELTLFPDEVDIVLPVDRVVEVAGGGVLGGGVLDGSVLGGGVLGGVLDGGVLGGALDVDILDDHDELLDNEDEDPFADDGGAFGLLKAVKGP